MQESRHHDPCRSVCHRSEHNEVTWDLRVVHLLTGRAAVCNGKNFESFCSKRGVAGPQTRASAGSVPRQTLTASVGGQCSPPDLNHELQLAVFPSRPQP